jgi:hypothetical protein
MECVFFSGLDGQGHEHAALRMARVGPKLPGLTRE